MTNPLQTTLEDREGHWVLTFIRDFSHPAEAVWPWLTRPERLRRWSPVVPDRSFDGVGPRQVRENPGDDPIDGTVISVNAPHELEHQMADRGHEAENAGGWHICLDVLAGNLDGMNPKRLVGEAVMERGFGELRDGYRKLLGAWAESAVAATGPLGSVAKLWTNAVSSRPHPTTATATHARHNSARESAVIRRATSAGACR